MASFRPISAFVPAAARLRAPGRENAARLFALARAWENIAPPWLARVARPVSLRRGPSGGTLTLVCAREATLDALYETEATLARVNAFFGAEVATSVRVRVRAER